MHINPSILSADFANLEAELLSIASADMAHVDVMDNHFVPNLTLGTAIVERLAQVSPIPLDVHLMIENPDEWAIDYAQTGAASVTFHLEAASEPISLARKLRAAGVKAAVAIKPATKVSEIAELIQEVDMLLVMTVEPGFGGQPILVETLEKIAQAAQPGVDFGKMGEAFDTLQAELTSVSTRLTEAAELLQTQQSAAITRVESLELTSGLVERSALEKFAELASKFTELEALYHGSAAAPAPA